MLNDNPQNKLSSQLQQANLNQKSANSTGQIQDQRAQKPISTDTSNPPKPDTNQKLDSSTQATITDPDGATRTLPENESSGFRAQLQKKVQRGNTESMQQGYASGKEPTGPGIDDTKATPGVEAPKPNLGTPMPKPKSVTPNPPGTNIPKVGKLLKRPAVKFARVAKPTKPRF